MTQPPHAVYLADVLVHLLAADAMLCEMHVSVALTDPARVVDLARDVTALVWRQADEIARYRAALQILVEFGAADAPAFASAVLAGADAEAVHAADVATARRVK